MNARTVSATGVFAVVAAIFSLPASAQNDTPGDARVTAIYERARDAVDALPLPSYVAFTEQNLSMPARDTQETLRIVVRVSDGHAIVRVLRDASGVAVTEPPQVVAKPRYPMTSIYRIGDFPLADFGMRSSASRPGVFEASGTPEPAASQEALHTLVAVKVFDVPYRLTDLGATMLGARNVDHLALQPLRDPGHHVLRELWIDRATSLPVRYVAERFVAGDAIAFRYLVTVDAALVDGHLVNVEADGHYNVNRALIVHISGEGHWRITDVSFPVNVPDWAFDANQLAAHRDEDVPGL